MPISHFGLTFSPVVTLHVEWWKMLTKNRSSSTLGQVPHRLRVSKPLPTARPVHASTALKAFYILCSSFNPHSHSEVGNWGTEKLRNSQGPSSSVWLLSPRSSPLPVLLCRGPACLPFPSLPLSSLPLLMLVPLLKCSSQHSQLVFSFLYSVAVPYSFSSEKGDFTVITILICMMHMSVDLFSCPD